jgi:hypothetical protein
VPRHQENQRVDVLAGLTVPDAHAKVDRLARAGIRASVFATSLVVSDVFPSDDTVQLIVAPEDRPEAERILAELDAEPPRGPDPAPDHPEPTP